VKEASATNSGLLLAPMMLGLLTASIVSGQVISRTGRYKFFPIAGTAVLIGGLLLFTQLRSTTPLPLVMAFMVIVGLGMGQVMQVLVLAVQNDVDPRDIGIATSGASFFRSLGGAFGTALFGAVLTSRVNHELPKLVSAERLHAVGLSAANLLSQGPDQIRLLPADVHA